MTKLTYQKIISIIGPLIQNKKMRDCVYPEERMPIALRLVIILQRYVCNILMLLNVKFVGVGKKIRPDSPVVRESEYEASGRGFNPRLEQIFLRLIIFSIRW